VEIFGESAIGRAVWIVERPETTVEDVRIDQTGERRDGLYLVRSPNCTVRNCSLLIGRYPVLIRPNEEPVDACLVRLDATEFLGALDDFRDVLRRIPVDLGVSRTFCVDPDYADIRSVNDPVIALTRIREDGVLKEVIPRQSLDS
jgi:hypothetical protein